MFRRAKNRIASSVRRALDSLDSDADADSDSDDRVDTTSTKVQARSNALPSLADHWTGHAWGESLIGDQQPAMEADIDSTLLELVRDMEFYDWNELKNYWEVMDIPIFDLAKRWKECSFLLIRFVAQRLQTHLQNTYHIIIYSENMTLILQYLILLHHIFWLCPPLQEPDLTRLRVNRSLSYFVSIEEVYVLDEHAISIGSMWSYIDHVMTHGTVVRSNGKTTSTIRRTGNYVTSLGTLNEWVSGLSLLASRIRELTWDEVEDNSTEIPLMELARDLAGVFPPLRREIMEPLVNKQTAKPIFLKALRLVQLLICEEPPTACGYFIYIANEGVRNATQDYLDSVLDDVDSERFITEIERLNILLTDETAREDQRNETGRKLARLLGSMPTTFTVKSTPLPSFMTDEGGGYVEIDKYPDPKLLMRARVEFAITFPDPDNGGYFDVASILAQSPLNLSDEVRETIYGYLERRQVHEVCSALQLLHATILYGPASFREKILEDTTLVDSLKSNPNLAIRLEVGRVRQLISKCRLQGDSLKPNTSPPGEANTMGQAPAYRTIDASGLPESLRDAWQEVSPQNHPTRIARSLQQLIDGVPVELDLSHQVEKKGTRAVATGGFAEVWRGEWHVPPGPTPLQVAVKVLRLQELDGDDKVLRLQNSMFREFDVWRRARNPHIVPLYGFMIEDDGAPALVSPWFNNGSLWKYLKEKPLAGDRKALLFQAAQGLAYLHSHDPVIVHGDIKSANILINDDGEALLCDFGMAKLQQEGPTGFTTSTVGLGTLRWTAPEILFEVPISCASDIWSFACLILEVMSSKPPFRKTLSDAAVAFEICRGKKPGNRDDYPEIPRNDTMWFILESCWAPRPAHRMPLEKIIEAWV